MPRRILALATVLILSAAARALTPPMRINFQGKLIDPSTNLPRNGSYSMTFAVYSDPGGSPATPLYTESQTVSVTNGVFSVQIGTTSALSRDLFLGASAYLGVTVGADSEMKPVQQLIMAPYAFSASQLSDASDVRLVAGATYSTFTSAGNLTVPGGLSGSSGTFTNGITASSGTFANAVTASSATLTYGIAAATGSFTATGAAQYSLTTSSGIAMNDGTLRVGPSGGGINAAGTGITAATGTFTATGQTQYSLTASSGIQVLAGKVDAPVFIGDGAELTTVRPEISTHSVTTSFGAATAVEVVVSSTQVNPARSDSRFLLWGNMDLNRSANSLATWTIRLRRNIGSACTTASTQVDISFTHTVVNTAGTVHHVHVDFVDAPATTSTVFYCLTAIQSSGNTHNVGPRNFGAMEFFPAR